MRDSSLLAASAAPAPARRLDRWLGRLLRRQFVGSPLRIAMRGGPVLFEPEAEAVATVWLGDRAALLSLIHDPETRFGDAYAEGRIDVDGDLVAALDAAYEAIERHPRLRRAPRAGHSEQASRDNVHHHYDLGNGFYRLWLDEQMVYTCAYFPRGDEAIEAAQVAKMEHVCRKLRLRPGEHVGEAGCGWGALALHMARRHGVRVTAYNLSAEQVEFARRRCRDEGLEDRVTFVLDDYRHIAQRFDAFVSVGMLEHVGPGNFATLAAVIDRCLDPRRGRGLLHFIGRDRPRALNPWIRRRIFPGAYPPTLAEALAGVLEPAGLVALDVENLRLHYARTLEHWLARYERAAEAVRARYGPTFMRTWRLYLAGSASAFRTGSLQLFQVLFTRPGSTDVPWSRAGLYAAGGSGGVL